MVNSSVLCNNNTLVIHVVHVSVTAVCMLWSSVYLRLNFVLHFDATCWWIRFSLRKIYTSWTLCLFLLSFKYTFLSRFIQVLSLCVSGTRWFLSFYFNAFKQHNKQQSAAISNERIKIKLSKNALVCQQWKVVWVKFELCSQFIKTPNY